MFRSVSTCKKANKQNLRVLRLIRKNYTIRKNYLISKLIYLEAVLQHVINNVNKILRNVLCIKMIAWPTLSIDTLIIWG